MPLDFHEIMATIKERLPEIRELSDIDARNAEIGQKLMERLGELDFHEFTSLLPSESHGAIPVPQPGEKNDDWRFIRRFEPGFDNTAGARAWAREVLSGTAVAAVDGSQIYPGRELSLPFGLVNTGWYINYHNGKYELDHTSALLLPDDLGYNPETGVNLKREEAEIGKLVEILSRLGKDDLVLLDGSVVASFALHMFESFRKEYINQILSLIRATKARDAPLFAAYIDSSRATDLAVMFSHLLLSPGDDLTHEDGQSTGRLIDASIIGRSMHWGDRTSAFICARDDILKFYRTETEDHSRDIAFFYLKTSLNGIARVEFPRLILEQGRLGQLADIIRAQVIVGEGYPHVLNRAHHEANVSLVEREKCLSILRKVASDHGITIGCSLKAMKKRS